MAYEQLPSIQNRTLGSLYNTNEPFAVQRVGQEQSQSVAQSTPPSQFGQALMAMLQQSQDLGQQTLNVSQREQAKSVLGGVPSNLIGASPEQQTRVLGARSETFEPSIGGARSLIQESEKAIGRFQQLQKDKELQENRIRDDARQNINLMIASKNTAGLRALIATQPDMVKFAGFDPKTLEAALPGLEAQEEASLTSIQAIANPLTGEIIFYNRKGQIVNRSGDGIPTPTIPTPTGETPQPKPLIPPQIQAAISKIGNIQYIDTTKLNEKQKPFAQNISIQHGIPFVDETSAKELKRAEATYNSALGLINTIENTAFKVIKAKNYLNIPGQLFTITKGRFTRDPNVNAYVAAIDAFVSLLTRAAGEKGVLTTIDVGRIKKALPKQYDTVESAQAALDTLSSVFDQEIQGQISAYLGISTQQQTGTGQGQTKSGVKFKILP